MRLHILLASALLAMISSSADAAPVGAPSAPTTPPATVFNPILQGRSLEEVLADCDPATGVPRGFPVPQVGGQRTGAIINPTWYERPGPEEIAKLYPEAARKAGVAGRAVVSCVVGADGSHHDCQVVEETPPGAGFGPAALQFAERARSVPRRRDCVAVDGAVIRFPLSFAP